MPKTMHERILEGAGKLCFTLGFARVRVEEIAEYLGISKKTIYNHFANKEALFEDVVEENIAAILDGLDQRARETGIAFTEKLQSILDFVVHELQSRSAVLFATDRSTNQLFRDRMVTMVRRKVVKLTGRLFEEGKAGGAVRNDIKPGILAYVYMGLIEGTFQLCADPQTPYPPEVLIREALRVSLVGVLSEEETRVLLTQEEKT